jgi:hypothetical protein
MEILIVGAIILYIFFYNNTIDKEKFIADNEKYLEIIKEEDYTFLLYAKYGDDINPDQIYMKRCTQSIMIFLIVLVLSIGGAATGGQNIVLNMVFAAVIAVLYFKSQYFSLRSFYKRHLHEIDIMLPYYLKSLEILIQHYTVPVALGKSIDDAPEIFKPGLRRLIDRINAGDSSVDPYMEFANTYPVRDSMRMMRLLYRLGIGGQEKKEERLMMFSRSISALQNKARETKYKERLDKMESLTMIMLVVTGVVVMLLILVTMMLMFSF